MKKLVFVDSDGTLKNNEGKISERTLNTLTKLKQKDIDVVITTGRPRYHALKVKDNSNASRYVISSNGAEVYDCVEDKVIYGNYLSKDMVLKIFEITDRYNCTCLMTIEDKEVVRDIPKNNNQVKLEGELNSYLDTHNVKQLFIKSDNEKAINKVFNIVKDINEVSIVNVSVYFNDGTIEEKGIWFSVADKGVNKGVAILQLCKYLNVNLENTYGFGNDYNDIDMFNIVKHSIVMDNAYDELKSKAKIIAKSNSEDGVALLLEELFLKEEE